MGVKRADAVALRNKVISCIKEHGMVTASRVAADLSMNVKSIGALLYTMCRDGQIEKTSQKSKSGRFNLYHANTTRRVALRENGNAREFLSILAEIEHRGSITSSELRGCYPHSDRRHHDMLYAMKEADLIRFFEKSYQLTSRGATQLARARRNNEVKRIGLMAERTTSMLLKNAWKARVGC